MHELTPISAKKVTELQCGKTSAKIYAASRVKVGSVLEWALFIITKTRSDICGSFTWKFK